MVVCTTSFIRLLFITRVWRHTQVRTGVFMKEYVFKFCCVLYVNKSDFLCKQVFLSLVSLQVLHKAAVLYLLDSVCPGYSDLSPKC